MSFKKDICGVEFPGVPEHVFYLLMKSKFRERYKSDGIVDNTFKYHSLNNYKNDFSFLAFN